MKEFYIDDTIRSDPRWVGAFRVSWGSEAFVYTCVLTYHYLLHYYPGGCKVRSTLRGVNRVLRGRDEAPMNLEELEEVLDHLIHIGAVEVIGT